MIALLVMRAAVHRLRHGRDVSWIGAPWLVGLVGADIRRCPCGAISVRTMSQSSEVASSLEDALGQRWCPVFALRDRINKVSLPRAVALR